MEEEDDEGPVAVPKRVTFEKGPIKKKAVVELPKTAPLKQNRKRPIVDDATNKPAPKMARKDSSESDIGSSGSDEDDDDSSHVLTRSARNGNMPHPPTKNSGQPPLPAVNKGTLLTQPMGGPHGNFADELEVKPECLGLFEADSRQRAAKEVARMALMVFSSGSETDYDLEELPPPTHPKKQSKKKASLSSKPMVKNHKGSKVNQGVKSSKIALNNGPAHVEVKIEPGTVSDPERDLPKAAQPSSLRVKEMDAAAAGSSAKTKLSLHKKKPKTG